jgi:hypothetical protein
MTTETTTADSGAGDVAPAAVAPPTNDAQAALQEQQQAAKPEPTAEDKAKAEEAKKDGDKSRNRTRDYINKLNADLAEERRARAELQRQVEQGRHAQPRQAAQTADHDGPPRLEDFEWDLERWQRANIDYTRQELTKEHQQAESQRKQQTTVDTYMQRVDAFAESHPDFMEAVGLIDQRMLTPELQLAVMAHERGPEIAYHLANNDEALFNIASIRPELQAAAVERLAARLSAAPPPAVIPPAAPAFVPPPKPLTQAPPPPPRVGGRAVAETPAEKLTDDDWYRADRERRRKR